MTHAYKHKSKALVNVSGNSVRTPSQDFAASEITVTSDIQLCVVL